MLTRLIQQLRGEPLHHRAKNTTQSSLSETERSQKEVRVEATMKTKQMEGGRQVERERKTALGEIRDTEDYDCTIWTKNIGKYCDCD